MTRVAAIDCGTNTIRLLIADLIAPVIADADPTVPSAPWAGWSLQPVLRCHEIVRLGQGVDRTGLLDETALERTLAVVDSYADSCRTHGVERMRFVATSATRDAANRQVFVDGVRQRLGIEPEVVSGQEEARLSFAGTLLGLSANSATPRLIVDLGGGSTELVLGHDAPQAAFSMDTGSVRVTERYLAGGLTPEGERAARAHVRELLDRAAAHVPIGQARELVGLAGTITTVTAHALGLDTFDVDALSGARLPVSDILSSCEAIVHSSPQERESWGYLRPGRRDVIAAGALVWSEVIERVVADTSAQGDGVQMVTTSLFDILDGIAISLANRASSAASGVR